MQVASIVTPETLPAWHRKLVAAKYDGSSKRGPGRPRTRAEVEALVVWMAEENRTWGYDRIVGALANLSHDVSPNTVANILKRHGIEPAPERERKTTWKEFVSRHFQASAAFSEPERFRRAIRQVDQGRMFGANDLLWRRRIEDRHTRVPCPLPRGAKSSRAQPSVNCPELRQMER